MAKFLLVQRDKILEHAASVGVTSRGLEYVNAAIDAPSRTSGKGGLRSFGVVVASAVQGCTVEAESATVELKYVLRTLLHIRSRLVLNQPDRLMVRGKSKTGRNTSFPYTPDYIDVQDGAVTAFECKAEEALRKLVIDRPFDYRLENGSYRFIPGENKFRSMGMGFKVFSDAEVTSTQLANLMLLFPFQQQSLPEDLLRRIECIRARVRETPLSLKKLRVHFGQGADMTVLAAIANGLLSSCMESTLLTDAPKATIFADAEAAALEDGRRRQAQRAEQLAEDDAWARSGAKLRASDARAAYRRLSRISKLAEGQEVSAYYSQLAASIAKGIQEGLSPEIAAATHYANSGNRGCRIEPQLPFLRECYSTHIATPAPKSMREAHGLLQANLEAEQLDPVSYTTWRKFVVAQGDQQTALAQRGPRGYQANAPRTDESDRRPLALTAGQIVHVDSSPEDCRMFAEIAGVIGLERPALALAVCERTNLILGFAVAFGNASRFLLALLLRDVIRRWGFYPPWIVNDGGPEHRSGMWRAAAAWNRTSIILRPVAAARAGATVENAIRYVNYGVLRKLSGSTRNDEAQRSASNTTKSRATAVHDYAVVQQLVEEFVHQHLPEMPRGFAHGSPRDLFEADRALRPVGWKASMDDPMTVIETSVPINVRKFDLDPTSGIRVGHRNYRSAELLDAANRNRKFAQVRLDPEDPSTIYVQFADGWVKARSNDVADLKLLSSAELLVEGMHSSERWERNSKTRQAEQLKINNKIEQLEAAAKAKKRPEPTASHANSAIEATESEDAFARFAANPKKFSVNEY